MYFIMSAILISILWLEGYGLRLLRDNVSLAIFLIICGLITYGWIRLAKKIDDAEQR